MSIRVVPTIEIEPCRWLQSGYDSVLGTPAWDDFWKDQLATWQLTPVVPGSWLVPVTSITSPLTMERLLLGALDGAGIHGFPDSDGQVDEDANRLPALLGGYVFFVDDQAVIVPGCCCDLGDLGAWRAAARDTYEPRRLNIGHACWHVARDGGDLVVEEHSERAGQLTISTRFAAHEVLEATFAAEQALRELSSRLEPTAAKLLMDSQRAAHVVALLTGLPVAEA